MCLLEESHRAGVAKAAQYGVCASQKYIWQPIGRELPLNWSAFLFTVKNKGNLEPVLDPLDDSLLQEELSILRRGFGLSFFGVPSFAAVLLKRLLQKVVGLGVDL